MTVKVDVHLALELRSMPLLREMLGEDIGNNTSRATVYKEVTDAGLIYIVKIALDIDADKAHLEFQVRDADRRVEIIVPQHTFVSHVFDGEKSTGFDERTLVSYDHPVYVGNSAKDARAALNKIFNGLIVQIYG